MTRSTHAQGNPESHRSMKIVIDARMLGWSGIGRYTSKLLEHMQKLDTDNTYLVLLTKKEYKAWQPTAKNFSKVLADIRPFSWSEQIRLPKLLKQLKPDLVHFLNFNAPVLYSGKRITTIHDLTLLDFYPYRGFMSRLKYWPMRWVFRHSITSSRRLLVPSRYVKGQLLKRYRVVTDKISVSHEATEAISQHPSAVKVLKGQPFILYVGNAYPHKNLSTLIKAFELLQLDFPELRLVLCGHQDGFYKQLASETKNPKLHFLSNVTDASLVWLYQHAKAFVFPSLSEGFGLTGLEAMQAGTPVLASQATSLPEVYGKAAIYFDPEQPSDIAKQVSGLLKDASLQKQLTAAGYAQAKLYAWDKTVRITLRAYSESVK